MTRLSTTAACMALMTLMTAATSLTVNVQAQDAAPPPVAAAPADPAAKAAAIELMNATGDTKAFDNIMSMMRKHIQASAQGEAAAAATMKTFDEMMVNFAAYKPQMIEETAALYAQKMTVVEMKAITEFYKTGPGAKFVSILPELMKEAGGIGQKYAMKMMQEYRAAKKP
jgi:uncharacterized protein